jgi:hypothetical protein
MQIEIALGSFTFPFSEKKKRCKQFIVTYCHMLPSARIFKHYLKQRERHVFSSVCCYLDVASYGLKRKY